jgi:hypothetical protein
VIIVLQGIDRIESATQGGHTAVEIPRRKADLC